jgi:Fe-S oxidoreductase
MHSIAISRSLILPPEDELWSCTSCSTCEISCPKKISPIEAIISLRNVVVEEGRIAPTIQDALKSIYRHGNPWGFVRSRRSEWAESLKVSHISDSELLYFVGCTPAYDPRVQNVAISLVNCFDKAGIDFGILGNEESCCGSEIYSMGEKGLFKLLVEDNTKLFEKYGIDQVVTTSPHCYSVFKNRYGKTGFEVKHYTQYVLDLIEQEKLSLSKEIKKVISYHDPCYLGKKNGIYTEPRKIIENIPGVTLVELDRSRERSLCCEGGGGRMWIEIPGERLAENRIRDAVDAGAEILTTACPFCLLTLEDAVKTGGYEESIKVMDIAELVSEAL